MFTCRSLSCPCCVWLIFCAACSLLSLSSLLLSLAVGSSQTAFLQLQELGMRNTTSTSSAFAALLFTPSSNLRSATSSPRPQLCVSTLTSMAPLSLHTYTLTLTNLSPPIHFPLLRYPFPAPPSVCEASTFSSFSSLSLTTPTPIHIFPPSSESSSRFIRYNKQPDRLYNILLTRRCYQ